MIRQLIVNVTTDHTWRGKIDFKEQQLPKILVNLLSIRTINLKQLQSLLFIYCFLLFFFLTTSTVILLRPKTMSSRPLSAKNSIEIKVPQPPPNLFSQSLQSVHLGQLIQFSWFVLQVPPFLTHLPDTLLIKISTQNFQGIFLRAKNIIHDIIHDNVLHVSDQEPQMSSK